MNPLYSEFKRKFSFSMYKNLEIGLGEMTFTKDFTDSSRGNLYPVISKSDDCCEKTEYNRYVLEKGSIKRLFCQFFPFATYEVSASITDGSMGFCFKTPKAEASITIGDKIHFSCGGSYQEANLPDFAEKEITLIVSCRPGAFDVYLKNNSKPEYICTFYEEIFKASNNYCLFKDSYALLTAIGSVTVKEVLSYIDNGISVADIRPVKYENGEVIQEQGTIWFTASVRMQEGSFQGVFSWRVGTAEFNMTAAVFYDCGDGFWHNFVAPVTFFDRKSKKWYVWVSTFEHEHILAYSAFEGEIRLGVNVVDVKIMEKASDTSSFSSFKGFKGDEDPDIIYDEENKRWLMAICRINPKTKRYNYTFFESQNISEGYSYIGCGADGEETGGSFVKAKGELFFVCGNGSSVTSQYRIYSKDGMKTAKFNFSDGGFRGWGSVFSVKSGSRTRYFWLTFDRHCGSSYNWSYGNIYCFEADT